MNRVIAVAAIVGLSLSAAISCGGGPVGRWAGADKSCTRTQFGSMVANIPSVAGGRMGSVGSAGPFGPFRVRRVPAAYAAYLTVVVFMKSSYSKQTAGTPW